MRWSADSAKARGFPHLEAIGAPVRYAEGASRTPDRIHRAPDVPAAYQQLQSAFRAVNPELEVFGLLRTMVDPRINLSNEVSDQLVAHFEDKVFRTVVPRNVRLAEAPSFGRPALLHEPDHGVPERDRYRRCR